MKYSKWMKKSLIILISILTFGLITPSELHWLEDASANKSPKKDSFEEAKSSDIQKHYTYVHDRNKETFMNEIMEKAELNAYVKFGDKIKPRIENEFKEFILPKIEEAIAMVAATHDEDDLAQLAISEKPTGGTGEKIFHIYHEKTGQDVIRFHVRREKPPQQGYWFNFHYHLADDNFVKHYDLGSLYWDKNTPPNWTGGSIYS
jgi:hypothetical protein